MCEHVDVSAMVALRPSSPWLYELLQRRQRLLVGAYCWLVLVLCHGRISSCCGFSFEQPSASACRWRLRQQPLRLIAATPLTQCNCVDGKSRSQACGSSGEAEIDGDSVDFPMSPHRAQHNANCIIESLARGQCSVVCLEPPWKNSEENTAVMPPFWSSFTKEDVEDWKRDALALKAAGFGASAGVVQDRSSLITASTTKTTTSNSTIVSPIRAKVHQIWLQTPRENGRDVKSPPNERWAASSFPLDRTMVGYIDARRRLLRLLESLRMELDEAAEATTTTEASLESASTHWLPHDLVEASYVVYDSNGAYYQEHLDVPTSEATVAANQATTTRRRAVSVLLYLGPFGGTGSDDNDDSGHEAEWSRDLDGGELRIHGAHHTRWLPIEKDITIQGTERAFLDIAPLPGTLVLFDSSTVPHEVRPTIRRGRVAVVAWFGTMVERQRPHLG
jgi:2OG-Fe(II) oxygenase superfamily